MNNDRIKKLLVVDDEASHRMMIEAVLQDVGWLVEEAESGEEALQILEESRPSVVLLDMRMPGMSGQETLQKILEIHPGLPVIMLTAHGTVDSAVEAMKLGAYDYLSKPADADDVARALLARKDEAPAPPENPMSADRVRWEHIQRVYELCGHNVSETARRLNMHRRTLQRILAKRAPR